MKKLNLNILRLSLNKSKARVSFNGVASLNLEQSEAIRSLLIDIVTTRQMVLEVDFQGVNFIDNSIVDALNLAARMSRKFQSRLYITNVGDALHELIQLIKVHSVFVPEIKEQVKTGRVAA
ncbi:MAG: STAS domain-containing protein [Bacteroidales bacterium]|nr:STAS domain-containing protein [Bacteroidales bacterium]